MEPLSRCDHCGMYIPAARLIKQIWAVRRNKATGMRIGQTGVEVTERYGEMEFRLYGREGGALVEVVAIVKYLGWTLYQMDNYWSEVRHNIKWARKVWRRLGNFSIKGRGRHQSTGNVLQCSDTGKYSSLAWRLE